MKKEAFALLTTIVLVLGFALMSVFIVENKAMNVQLDTQQIGYTQAQYHVKFCKKLLLEKIEIDPNKTKKIEFKNISNHKIIAIIYPLNATKIRIDLSVESLLHKHIRVHQSFEKEFTH
ncbi:MAG: hypothetical protein U9N30_02505 [Campylobacterota bacterium]|nr:hypothetical protein [Campylobacterota bacterium]